MLLASGSALPKNTGFCGVLSRQSISKAFVWTFTNRQLVFNREKRRNFYILCCSRAETFYPNKQRSEGISIGKSKALWNTPWCWHSCGRGIFLECLLVLEDGVEQVHRDCETVLKDGSSAEGCKMGLRVWERYEGWYLIPFKNCQPQLNHES